MVEKFKTKIKSYKSIICQSRDSLDFISTYLKLFLIWLNLINFWAENVCFIFGLKTCISCLDWKRFSCWKCALFLDLQLLFWKMYLFLGLKTCWTEISFFSDWKIVILFLRLKRCQTKNVYPLDDGFIVFYLY